MNSSGLNTADLDLIERYLDGELTHEERQSVENRINGEKGFADLIEARKEIQELWLSAKSREAIKEEVRRISQEGLNHEKNVPGLELLQSIHYKYYAIAASLIFIVGIAFAILLFNIGSGDGIIAFKNTKKTIVVQKPKGQAYKGKKGIYYGKNSIILLIKPDSGEVFRSGKEILFRWSYTADSITHFTILKFGNNFPVFVKKINSSENMLRFQADILKPGNYIWFIGNQKIKREFTIK